MTISNDDPDGMLASLLAATLKQEARIAERDTQIAAVQATFADVAARASLIADLNAQLQTYYTAHPAEDGKKSRQFEHGLIGMRSPSNPALVPISDKWPWDKIERKLRRLFKLRFFHAPKPPGVDKVKLKKEMSVEQMAKCGLKLDDTEHFYIELNRLAIGDKAA
jgi:Gam-like protein